MGIQEKTITVSLDLLHETEELLSPETERADPEAEAETTASEPISRFGLLSEELSGGAGAMYLREIAHHELLTAQEEVSLAQRLQGGKAALRELATAYETLDPAHRVELEHQAEDGERARRRLIECNLRLVVSVARRYLGRGLCFLPRSRTGRQHRPADRRREVRLAARVPIQHVRVLVDSPGSYARHRGPEPH